MLNSVLQFVQPYLTYQVESAAAYVAAALFFFAAIWLWSRRKAAYRRGVSVGLLRGFEQGRRMGQIAAFAAIRDRLAAKQPQHDSDVEAAILASIKPVSISACYASKFKTKRPRKKGGSSKNGR